MCIDTICFCVFEGHVDFVTNQYCLVDCLTMIVWTRAVVRVLHARALYVFLLALVPRN